MLFFDLENQTGNKLALVQCQLLPVQSFHIATINRVQFLEILKSKNPANFEIAGFLRFDNLCCDPAGIRTQDHYIKSVMLYQLSYGIIFLV